MLNLDKLTEIKLLTGESMGQGIISQRCRRSFIIISLVTWTFLIDIGWTVRQNSGALQWCYQRRVANEQFWWCLLSLLSFIRACYRSSDHFHRRRSIMRSSPLMTYRTLDMSVSVRITWRRGRSSMVFSSSLPHHQPGSLAVATRAQSRPEIESAHARRFHDRDAMFFDYQLHHSSNRLRGTGNESSRITTALLAAFTTWPQASHNRS